MPVGLHPEFTAPDNGAIIWRYMDFAKFLALIDRRSLYFASLITLEKDDPYEGHFPDRDVEAILKIGRSTEQVRSFMKLKKTLPARTVKSIFEIWRRTILANEINRHTTFVNCWHINSGESDAMWRLYSLQGQGIAIQSTYGRLSQALKKERRRIFIGKVQYKDYQVKNFTEFNGFGPALHKRSSFAHENELRAALDDVSHLGLKGEVFFQDDMLQRIRAQNPASRPSGTYVKVDVEVLIQSVVISPASPHWMTETIKSVLKRFGLDPKIVSQSKLLTRTDRSAL